MVAVYHLILLAEPQCNGRSESINLPDYSHAKFLGYGCLWRVASDVTAIFTVAELLNVSLKAVTKNQKQ